MELRFTKLQPEAKAPKYAHDTDAGLDLYTTESFTLLPGERRSIPTGIAIAVPEGCAGLIWDKSGIAHTRGLKTLGGVIDAGYRGEIFVGLVNVGTEPQTFVMGDKVAQLIVQAIAQPTPIEVDSLDATPRGEGRFGSTGHS
jgi:dUTP pyrophosphatase